MRAVSRLGLAMVAAGIALAPLSALAQTAPATTNTPATDAIGPRELQNFSLNGTVTKPADGPVTTAPRPRPSATRPAVDQTATAAPRAASVEPRQTPPRRETAASRQPTSDQPSLDFPTTASAAPAIAQPGFTSAPASQPALPPAPLAPEQKILLWPWLLLAALLGAAGALLLWRRRSHAALADGVQFDAYVAPEPAPSPRPAPPPPPPPAREPALPKPIGIVSSRLRPWIDIAFAPLGCLVQDDNVTIEFEVQLTNTGGAPARDLLVEASMFNAGASQEQDIGAFFANPQGEGERIETIAPLQNVSIRTSLVAPRQNIQLFELGGHQVFVPLIAFNVLYRLSNGPAQTSVAYMLGRDTKTDRLGPLRVDNAPRAFNKLGTHPLPIGVRN